VVQRDNEVREVGMADRNTKKLKDEGLLGDDLPPEYQSFIDGLGKKEIDELISLKQTLEAQGIEVEPIRLKDKGAAVPTRSMPVL
jgi:hypothetical protein